MNLTRCAQGHIYDSEKYDYCPHCMIWEPTEMPASMVTPPEDSPLMDNILPEPVSNEVQPFIMDTHNDFWTNPDPVILTKKERYESKVLSVIVYPGGTKTIRRVMFTPTEEQSTIYITDIPSHRVDDVHIRVSKGLTCFSQASVYWVSEEKAKEVEEQEKMAETEDLQEKKLWEKQMEDINVQSGYLMEQFDMWESIKKNCRKKLKKQKKECNVEEESAKFMQILEKQQKIREQLIECRNKYAELTEANEEKTVEKHLNDYGEKCLKLVLLAEPGQSYCLDIEYESREATWSPSYEIRVESGETQANVYLYANIDKTSDEPWENVNLTVSTGITQAFDPYILEGLKPMTLVKKIPKPMFMPEPSEFPLGAQFEDDKQIAQIGSDGEIPFPSQAQSSETINFDIEHTFNPEPIEIKETETSVRHEYHLQNQISLSKKVKEKIIIWKQKINVQPYYFAIPENDSAEYMAIRLTELQKCDVLTGNAKVYLDGEYTRTLFLRPKELDKQVVLGCAKGVTVKRTLRKNDENEKKLQGKTIENYEYVISVKNDLKRPIRLQVLDRIPITSDPDVQIEVKTSSGADINSGTGVCTWNVSLEAEKDCELELCYTITHPSKQNYECI